MSSNDQNYLNNASFSKAKLVKQTSSFSRLPTNARILFILGLGGLSKLAIYKYLDKRVVGERSLIHDIQKVLCP